MDDTVTSPTSAPPVDAAQRSLADDVRELTEAGKELAQAELAYQKARAAYAGKGARNIAIAGAIAAALVFFALMGLVLGLILSLAPILTPIGATAAVVAGLLIAAILCAMAARSSLTRMKAVLREPGDGDA